LPGHRLTVGQVPDIDTTDQRVWRAGQRQSVRVEDRRGTAAGVVERRIGRPNAAKGIIVGQAERIADAGVSAVAAFELLTPFS
jgi:hypothetical protein